MTNATLYFFCGKMGAGKSTASKSLAEEKGAVLISEDDWLARLFPGQIKTLDDYVLYSGRLRPVISAHVKNILATGTDVVMDFPANTVKQRMWFKSLYQAVGAAGKLLYLETSDEVCLERLAKRRVEQPERAGFDNETVFRQVTQFFEEPAATEGLEVEVC